MSLSLVIIAILIALLGMSALFPNSVRWKVLMAESIVVFVALLLAVGLGLQETLLTRLPKWEVIFLSVLSCFAALLMALLAVKLRPMSSSKPTDGVLQIREESNDSIQSRKIKEEVDTLTEMDDDPELQGNAEEIFVKCFVSPMFKSRPVVIALKNVVFDGEPSGRRINLAFEVARVELKWLSKTPSYQKATAVFHQYVGSKTNYYEQVNNSNYQQSERRDMKACLEQALEKLEKEISQTER